MLEIENMLYGMGSLPAALPQLLSSKPTYRMHTALTPSESNIPNAPVTPYFLNKILQLLSITTLEVKFLSQESVKDSQTIS